MTSKLTMPKRDARDGAVEIAREEGGLRLRAEDDCAMHSMFVSEYNAWRLFGLLALMLRIPLPSHIGKAITFGDKGVTAKVGPKAKPTRLGDKMAAAVIRKRLGSKETSDA